MHTKTCYTTWVPLSRRFKSIFANTKCMALRRINTNHGDRGSQKGKEVRGSDLRFSVTSVPESGSEKLGNSEVDVDSSKRFSSTKVSFTNKRSRFPCQAPY
jgi:hypothetical protein